MQTSYAVVVLLFVASVLGDIYMHNPRGSNNRVEENNVNAAQQNRLFDSQNNAKGGYCWGPAMSFYERSLLMVEWTNQHGCGANGKLYCNVVIQYMCSDSNAPIELLVRDGVTTDQIPNNEAGVTALATADSNNNNNNVDTPVRVGQPLYGMHESLQYYQACSTRNRNEGLWINDRNLNQGNSRSTRQNNGGGRSGFECPEERDYYPYWAPSPWRDIAILTHDMSWCEFYKKESQNVKSRWFCADAETGEQAAPNNEAECRQQNQIWTEVPAWNIPAPDCVPAPFARDNHLGDSGQSRGGLSANYNWTLPNSNELPCIASNNCNCVLRIRYNISTTDLGADGNRPDSGFIDWTSNAGASPITQNPIVEQDGQAFTLAINTNQFGRTFQDRSHVFHIRPRPDGVPSKARIFNLNVRGKRGNIVQAYPSVEYDFIPDHFIGRTGDYMHFQWTGCDNNPANNAGEGTASTDRSNMVQIQEYGASLAATDEWIAANKPLFESVELRRHMAMAGQVNCLSREELENLNNNDPENCLKLNKAPEYFDGGLIKFNTTGKFHYMSTRNNSFTNRGQKGIIEIVPLLPTWAIVVVVIGAVLFALAGVLAGLVFYAKANPSSPLATTFEKM